VVFAAGSNSLSSPFLLDDLSKVRDNPDIRSLSPAALVYPYADNAAQNIRRNDPSRPLVFLSYALNYVLLGPSPWHFRAVNVCCPFFNYPEQRKLRLGTRPEWLMIGALGVAGFADLGACVQRVATSSFSMRGCRLLRVAQPPSLG
jgi:hypothetical protein